MQNTTNPLELRVRVDKLEQVLMFDYEPGTGDRLFGLFDPDGNPVLLEQANGPITHIRVLDMDGTSLASMDAPKAFRKAV